MEALVMTKEEIIELAKKADLTQHENPHFGTYTATTVSLMRFAKLIAEHERDACADLCEQYGFNNHCGTTTDVIANAIRARGEA